LYSQIPTSLINAGLVFWTVRIFFFKQLEVTPEYKGYIAMAVIANLLYFIFSLIAAVKARKGYFYYFLFFGKVAYQRVYMVKPDEENVTPPVNKPPIQ
jgi:uncharacterized membrane protein